MTSITRARDVFDRRKQGLKDSSHGIKKWAQPLLFVTAAGDYLTLAKGKKKKWSPRMLEIQKNSVAHLLPIIILAASLAIETEYLVAFGAVTLFLLASLAGLSQMGHGDSK